MNNSEGKSLPWFGIPALWPYLKPYRWKMLTMVIFGILSSAADSIYPLFNRYALNHFVGERTLDGFPRFLLLYVAVLAGQVVSNLVSSLLISFAELDIGRDLKNTAFRHLQTLSFSYFNTHSVGYIHARVMSDTDRIGTLVTWRMMDIVWNVSYIVFVFGVMMAVDLRLALLLLLLVPVAAALAAWFQRKLVVLNRSVRELNAKITGNFNEGITGARTIRTLVAEERMQRGFEEDTEKMRRAAVHTARVQALFTASVTAMAGLALALVLWRGGKLTQEGAMQLGTLSVFMSYALGMMEPIQYIIQAVAALVSAQVNIERFTRLAATPSDVQDRPEVVEKYGDSFHPKRENWEPIRGDVEFQDVSFHYPDGKEMVLEHFSLRVPAGTSVAIVGETGAGKSTLVNLVCRFYEPTAGKILIDGRDVRDRSQLWLHSRIGYVLQTPHLFSGTVRENLRYGKPDASDEEIWRALRLVSADRVVERMGDGLDSEVGEGGSLLSTGEKQLLSFARALLADPAILILDEATSSVDTMTEQMIQKAIRTVVSGRTSFMIAHRLSTITGADRILAVQDGKIVESGTHRELLRKKGYYYRLYTRQYQDLATDELI
jgi:ATP-binding cassette subfamily B protein